VSDPTTEVTTPSTPQDQTDAVDPNTAYAQPEFPEQQQDKVGLASEMTPRPDHGEDSYVGRGRLEGRTALITGADSGIGRAVAIAFAREGADLVLTYLPEEQADADEVIALVEAAGRKVTAVPGDLTVEAFNTDLVQQAVDALGRIDVLVSVAGHQQAQKAIADLTTDQFDQTMKTNVYSLFWTVKAALPHIPAGGSIITTSSVQAYTPSPTLLDYASTKSAINTFTKALAQQVAEKGIRANVVAPGPFWTPLQVDGGQPAEMVPTFGEQSEFGRPGQPAEIASAYVYLASGESSYTSGSTLSVTGGSPTP
jgi:NAD(P)-dependent dehydrogenase (short-subunit alcohol dehydrogenase family)